VSVLVVLPIPVDPDAFERVAAEKADTMKEITARSRERGAIHHAFFAGDDGKVYVVDEWDSAESFQAFFQDEAPNIGPLIEAANPTGEPGPPQFYRKLDSGDEF